MPYTKVLIHLIWATKNRQPIISKELKPELLAHIKDNSVHKGIHIDTVNCVADHIHLLVSLGSEQSIAKVVQLIKGESSFWANKQQLVHGKFEWQDDYIALDISQSGMDKVRQYILDQEAHHAKKTFVQEYGEFWFARVW